ncbi:snakin-2-like [Cucurbita moschata]|uniref:Snakin-2-like n=1 Tax=Cucurbita moschata TaxID=3662 RepID=A0A6J1GTU1_CUCMO|nr:snakin-2-like [Cucurbita moschata]
MAARFLLLGVLAFLCLSPASFLHGAPVGFDGNPRGGGGGGGMVRRPNERVMTKIDCGWECKRRCGAHSRPNRCLRVCGTCCLRCNCVPPGTSGNREMCGTCYTGMTTHGNKTKCP